MHILQSKKQQASKMALKECVQLTAMYHTKKEARLRIVFYFFKKMLWMAKSMNPKVPDSWFFLPVK